MSLTATMTYFCCDERRRARVRAHPTLNGIDYLEVVPAENKTDPDAQRALHVYFVKPASPDFANALAVLRPENYAVLGGERIGGIKVSAANLISDSSAVVGVELKLSERGDFSTYTLRMVSDGERPLSLPDAAGDELLDPLLTAVDFSFKVNCPSTLDCASSCDCPAPMGRVPELDYLAKDYATFRQLLLDRFAVLAPSWRERSEADLGMTLVELFAYVGDYLSYRQDAIATEAYLGTARRRTSVRRHALLLDYPMHDGRNARTWVQVQIYRDAPKTGLILPRFLVRGVDGVLRRAAEEPAPSAEPRVVRTRFITTATDDLGLWLPPTKTGVAKVEDDPAFAALAEALAPEVFEPLAEVRLFHAHNEIKFYTWGDAACCLPQGATRATLLHENEALHPIALAPGDLLCFVEQCGPKTGREADAERSHRHVVRLKTVRIYKDGNQSGGAFLEDPLTKDKLVEIEWGEEDALPFPLCISSRSELDGSPIENVSVARGNLVPVDHGWTRLSEKLPTYPASNPALAPAGSDACGRCAGERVGVQPARYRPRLREGPLTHAAPCELQLLGAPAEFFEPDLGAVRPAIRLGDDRGGLWKPQRDLLSSVSSALEFVAEVEHDGRTELRFGDDTNGLQPAAGTDFYAQYRVGHGAEGNIGADTITYLAASHLIDPADPDKPRLAAECVEQVNNPLPARGGLDAETIEEVRQFAPEAFRQRPRRAVTPEDYATAAERHPNVERAKATVRWTGSWHTIFLTVDRRGGKPVDAEFETALRAYLEPLRMAGHDLEITGPRFLALELELLVCVAPDHYRSTVEAALRVLFTYRTRPDGTLGFFHPDNFTFGTPLYASTVIAAAQAVPGVDRVQLITLRALGGADQEPRDVVQPEPLQILRLENNRSFLDRGTLKLRLKGGR